MTVTVTPMHDRGTDERGRRYWRIRYPDPDHPGRRASRALGWMTDAEAEAERKLLEARLLLGLEPSPDSAPPSTVQAVVEVYLAEIERRMGEDHPYVLEETKRLVGVTRHLGSLRADRVTESHLSGYAAQRHRETTRNKAPTAKSSIREEVACLLRAYRLARDLGAVECDPPKRPSLKGIPDDARPARRLTEAEVGRLLAAAAADDQPAERRPWRSAGGPGMATLLTVLAWSGRRPVAVFGVRRSDCDRALDETLPRRDRLMLWTRDKAGVGRGWGPLAEPALDAIVARCDEVTEPSALLWTTPTGLEWTPERVSRAFARIAEAAGVTDVEPYDLRRYAVTQILAAARGQVRVAMAYTGHRTAQSLLRYAYAAQGEAEDLAESIGSTPAALRLVKEE